MNYNTHGPHWILELGWNTEKGSMLTGKIRYTMEKKLESLLWNTAQEISKLHPSAEPGSRKVQMLPCSLISKAYLMGYTGTPLQVLKQSTPAIQVLNALVEDLTEASRIMVENYDNTNQDPQTNRTVLYYLSSLETETILSSLWCNHSPQAKDNQLP